MDVIVAELNSVKIKPIQVNSHTNNISYMDKSVVNSKLIHIVKTYNKYNPKRFIIGMMEISEIVYI